MKYEIKKLQASHLFLFINVVNKIGLDQFKDVVNSDEINNIKNGLVDKLKDAKEKKLDKEEILKLYDSEQDKLGGVVVLKIAGIILTNAPKAELDVYKFISALTDLSVKDVKTMSASDFMQVVIDIFQSDGAKDFFKLASSFLK